MMMQRTCGVRRAIAPHQLTMVPASKSLSILAARRHIAGGTALVTRSCPTRRSLHHRIAAATPSSRLVASFAPSASAGRRFPLALSHHLHTTRRVQERTATTTSPASTAPAAAAAVATPVDESAAPRASEAAEAEGAGRDPEQVAQAILNTLREAAGQGEAAKQRGARLRGLLRELNPGEGVGRALFAVSRELGLRRTGRLLPLIHSSQERGGVNRLAQLLLTLTHAHLQQGDKAPKDKVKALGELLNGCAETWEVDDITKLLRVIPRSSHFSLVDGKEHQPDRQTEWSPRELGGLVGQLKHDRAERRDLEFFMDILVKLLTTLEKDGGWGKEKLLEPVVVESTAAGSATPQDRQSKPVLAYDLDYVPKVVGPALAPFFDYWGNQDYATVMQCLVTAFSQHAVATYGQHTLNKVQFHHFCVEMMAQAAISSKPTVGMLHYMVNDITAGWQEEDVDRVSLTLEKRMKPYSFFRRWFRRLFNRPAPKEE